MPRRNAAPNRAVAPVANLEGQIRWLPKKEQLGAGVDGLDDGCYDHPVVILSKRQEDDGTVDVCIVTSLNDKPLADKRRAVRLRYLPIRPSNPHPDHSILLQLQDSCHGLDKKSYVNTANIRKIPLGQLRYQIGLHHAPNALCAESFQKLVDYCDYPQKGVDPAVPFSPEDRTAHEAAHRSSNISTTPDVGTLLSGSRPPARSSYTRSSFKEAQVGRAHRSFQPELPIYYNSIGGYTPAGSQQPLLVRPGRHYQSASYGTVSNRLPLSSGADWPGVKASSLAWWQKYAALILAAIAVIALCAVAAFCLPFWNLLSNLTPKANTPSSKESRRPLQQHAEGRFHHL